MLIDCDTCVGRGTACGSCVLSVILEPAGTGVELDEDEFSAINALADGGLVPPLRLVQESEHVSAGTRPAPGRSGRRRVG
jgi:hypothetical protein